MLSGLLSAAVLNPVPLRDSESSPVDASIDAQGDPPSRLYGPETGDDQVSDVPGGREPLRILLVAPRYLPLVGGTEIHTYEVSRRMAAQGHDVTVLTVNPQGRLASEEGVEGVRIIRKRAWLESLGYYIAPDIFRTVRAGDWDIVHCQGYHTLVAPLVMLASLRAKIPYVLTFHSAGHSSRLRASLRRLQRAIMRPLMVRADRLIGVSEFEVNLFRDELQLPPAKLAVIRNGSDLPQVDATGELGTTGPVLVSVGRLERYKGHHRVIEAMPEVLSRHPDARLVIVGQGPYRRNLMRMAEDYGVANSVEFMTVTGIDRAGMAAILARASLVVLLSEYESSGIAVLEGLALGRPVLVTDISGLHELAGQPLVAAVPLNATASQVATAINQQLHENHAGYRPQLTTWDDCAHNLLSVYQDVVAAARSRQRFRPVRLLEVEVSEPIPSVPRVDPATGRSYQRALTLCRLHDYPVGTVEITIGDSAVTAEEHARQIWTSLGTRINNHLKQDGLPMASELTPAGIPLRSTPNCRRERHAVLGRAPFVSVVVATRNRSHLLGECLHSLLNLEYPNYEILVVDNAPTSDETFQLVTGLSLGRPRLRYLREERAGTSWARNQGVLESTAGIVAFTDDDVIVDKHWLTEITKEFIASPDVGCVTGLVLPAQIETRVQAWFEERGGFSKGFDRRVFTRLSHTSENPPYPYVASIFGSGNNMACRVSVLSEFGGFDPALGPGTDALGGEDLAVFYQVIKGGYQLVYTPAAIAFHRHRVDYDAFRKQVRCFGLGLTAYMTKCFVDDPRSVLDFLSQLPAYAANLTRRTATSNGRERSDQPLELTFVELTGMVVGPIAYLRGRRKTRELRKTLASRFAPRIRPDRRRRPSSQRESSGAEGATSYE